MSFKGVMKGFLLMGLGIFVSFLVYQIEIAKPIAEVLVIISIFVGMIISYIGATEKDGKQDESEED